MKILALLSDYINIEPKKKAIKDAEKIEKKLLSEKECLVVFISAEKIDEKNTKNVAKNLKKQIEDISDKVKTKTIVLYPYVHLSNTPSSPKKALEILEETEKILKKDKYKTQRAPFGWYKGFEIKVKGHPLSELSREFSEEEEKETEEECDYKQLLKDVTKSRLDKSKLKDNDHRILSQKMDLFSFNEIAPGMVFWHNDGLVIYNELIKFWREEHKKQNYQEISTPQILDKKLWKISGHWEKYKENIFLTSYEGREFAVKPMNCPGGILIFKNTPKSYKDLPLRVAELGNVHRQELSGVLGGLFRVIQFTQDDAHIYCTEKQLEKELISVINLINQIYDVFNFESFIELSTRPEKRIGDEKLWDKAEDALEKVLKKQKIKYKLNKGDGAFYGPKIDFHIKDSLGRTWQCATLQLDFAMPERFDLNYIDKNSNKKRPIMLHRTIFGSLERFIGVLLEHTNGRLPLFLAPKQVRVISFTDRNQKYAQQVIEGLQKANPNLRIDSDFRSESIGLKIKDAQIKRIAYMVVVGDKEEQEKTISVKEGGQKESRNMSTDDLIAELKDKLDKKC